MLTITLNEKDPHILRVTASYLLALAAPEEAHDKHGLNHVTGLHNEMVDAFGSGQPANERDLVVELQAQTVYANEARPLDEAFIHVPAASEVFGSKLPEGVPYIAGADLSPTALADMTAITLVPPPAIAPLPPAQPDASEVSHAVPSTVSPVSNVALDARGLPWDSRIHSREKTHIANGNWKNKRGVPEKIIADVEAELRNLMAIAPPPPLAPAPIVTLPPSTIVAPPPAAITAPIANPSSEPFPALMTKVASSIAARKLNQAQVIEIVTQAGVPSLPGLIQRPDLIPNIEAAIDAQIMMNEASGVAQ